MDCYVKNVNLQESRHESIGNVCTSAAERAGAFTQPQRQVRSSALLNYLQNNFNSRLVLFEVLNFCILEQVRLSSIKVIADKKAQKTYLLDKDI